MAEIEKRPLLYVIAGSTTRTLLVDKAIRNFPAEMKDWFRRGNVQYLVSPDDIPKTGEAYAVPVLFLTSGGLEGYLSSIRDLSSKRDP